MIVQCENCKTKFNLDESLLKEDGSKVRCSVCGDVFVVYPPQEMEDISIDDASEFEETVAIDDAKVSPPIPEVEEGSVEPGFEEPDQEPLGEEDEIEVQISSEDLEGYEPEEMMAGQVAGAEPEGEQLPDAEKEEEPQLEPEPEMIEKEAVPAPKKRSKVGLIILIIIFILVGAAAGIFYFAPQLIPESLSFLKLPKKEQVKDTGVRRLEFKGVTGSFVDSKVAGQLFVVKGIVINNYPKARSYILVKASILDEKGKVVKTRDAYAGNNLTDQELKELPYGDIVKIMNNRAGRDGANVNLAPGSSVPFMIVFEKLPQDLSEFTVEAVRSSPGA